MRKITGKILAVLLSGTFLLSGMFPAAVSAEEIQVKKLNLVYREKNPLITDPNNAGQTLDISNTMYVTLDSGMDTVESGRYQFYLKAPGEEQNEITEQVRAAGRTGRQAYWTLDGAKAGKYTLIVKEKGETVATADANLVSVTFSTGSGKECLALPILLPVNRLRS